MYITIKLNIKLRNIHVYKNTILCENNVTVLELIKNISLRGIYGFTSLTQKTAVTVANGLHEPNESYPLIEREILTIDLIDIDVRHLENKEKNRDIERECILPIQHCTVAYCVF